MALFTGTIPLWFVTLVGALVLSLVTYFSPEGFTRLTQPRFWIFVGSSTLAAGLLCLYLGLKSDDPALMLNIGVLAVLSVFALCFLVGLFLPLSWPISYYAVLAAVVTVLAVTFVLWTK